jgi:hypothetical protein
LPVRSCWCGVSFVFFEHFLRHLDDGNVISHFLEVCLR